MMQEVEEEDGEEGRSSWTRVGWRKDERGGDLGGE